MSQTQQVPNSMGELGGGTQPKGGNVDNKTAVARDFNMPPPGCDADAIKLFVGSIPPKYTEDTLRPYFEKIGDVIEISVLEGRGSGFVWYKTRAQADRAIRDLDGKKPGIEPKDEHRPLEIRQARVKAEAGLVAGATSSSSTATPILTTPFSPSNLSQLSSGNLPSSMQLPNNLAGILANMPQLNQQPFNSYASNMPAIFQLLNYNPTLIVQFIDSLLFQNNQHIQFLTQLKQALTNLQVNTPAASPPSLSAFGRRSLDVPSTNRMSWDAQDFAAKRASVDLSNLSSLQGGSNSGLATQQSQQQQQPNTDALLSLLMSQQSLGGNNSNNNQFTQQQGSDLLASLSNLQQQQNQGQGGFDGGMFGGSQNIREVLLSQGRQNWANPNQQQWWGDSSGSGSTNRPSMEVVPENLAATCQGVDSTDFGSFRGLMDDNPATNANSDNDMSNLQFAGQMAPPPRASMDSMRSSMSGNRTSFESNNSSQNSILRHTAQFGSPASHLYGQFRPPFNPNQK
eukprot:TRINITY_DN4878_c0_g1_i2.p1 TRINITY_DN4878_c0_g1~~TRINITY_DN4878_c0_g1_i2.p1  ORF type:complete len:512 (-),score=75.32 TRINITY_DN4878_c0_g1_i2:3203-4738(-)